MKMPEVKTLPVTHSTMTNTDLAFERTAMAQERTLMAWVRTSISMISFGFTIYKFFQGIPNGAEGPHRLFTPRIVGMIMISFALVGLLLAMIQNHNAIKKIKQNYPEVPRSISSLLAIFILVFGLALFLGALFRQ
jgi:putative membrane protein